MATYYRRQLHSVENMATSMLGRSRWASQRMSRHFPSDDMRIWHIYRHHRKLTTIQFVILKFHSMLELIKITDFDMLYTCLVASRTDDKNIIPSESFSVYADTFESLRNVGFTAFPELIAWMSKRALSK